MTTSQSGHVKCQKRKSIRTSSVFWNMKMTSSPTPVSDAIAPPPSRRLSDPLGPPSIMTTPFALVRSAERERERLRAAFEELDLEPTVADRTVLPDHLIHPWVGEDAGSIGVDIPIVRAAE